VSQKACSLQGGYLLTYGNKYLFQVWVELVNLVDQTLVYALLPILCLAHTAHQLDIQLDFLPLVQFRATFIHHAEHTN
jgi:hypothetical protein